MPSSQDSGFKSIVANVVAMRKRQQIVISVRQLGFSEGANLISINARVKELGFEEFPDQMLLHAAKRPHKRYLPNTTFILTRKRK